MSRVAVVVLDEFLQLHVESLFLDDSRQKFIASGSLGLLNGGNRFAGFQRDWSAYRQKDFRIVFLRSHKARWCQTSELELAFFKLDAFRFYVLLSDARFRDGRSWLLTDNLTSKLS